MPDGASWSNDSFVPLDHYARINAAQNESTGPKNLVIGQFPLQSVAVWD